MELRQIKYYIKAAELLNFTEAAKAGSEFLPYAKQTIKDTEMGMQRLLDLQDIRKGTLKIGITYSLSFGLASILLRFMREYPNIKIEVKYNTALELLEMLKSRDLDLVFSLKMRVQEELVEMSDLYEAPLCAIVHKRHVLAPRKEISIKEVSQYSLVLPSKGLSARSALDEILKYYLLLDRLKPETVKKVCRDNVLSLIKKWN